MEKEKITFKYVYPEDFNPEYANGVCGCVLPTGEIMADFFLEQVPLPRYVTTDVKADGKISDNGVSEPDLKNKFLRHIVSGVVMNEDTAKMLYAWLGQMILECEMRKSRVSESAPQSEEAAAD